MLQAERLSLVLVSLEDFQKLEAFAEPFFHFIALSCVSLRLLFHLLEALADCGLFLGESALGLLPQFCLRGQLFHELPNFGLILGAQISQVRVRSRVLS